MTTQQKIDLPHYEGKINITKVKNEHNDYYDNNAVKIEHIALNGNLESACTFSSHLIVRKISSAIFLLDEQISNHKKDLSKHVGILNGIQFAKKELDKHGQITQTAINILNKQIDKQLVDNDIRLKKISFLSHARSTIKILREAVGLNWRHTDSLKEALLVRNQDDFKELLELVASVQGLIWHPTTFEDRDTNAYVDELKQTRLEGGVIQHYLDRVSTHVR